MRNSPTEWINWSGAKANAMAIVQFVFETIQHLIEAPEPGLQPKRQIGFPKDQA